MKTANVNMLCFALAGCLLSGAASGYEPLADEQLDAITAGADDTTLAEVTVQAARMTATGKLVTVDGAVGLQRLPNTIADAADLLLRDSAQSNLQALINMNAVNSVVNVLVNLNINIDSQVGELRQINLAPPPGR